MSGRMATRLGLVLLGGCLLSLSGCITGSYRTGSSGAHGNGGYYGHDTWNDPHRTGRCCRGGIIVRPPSHQTPGHRPLVVRTPRYPHRSVGGPPSIPSKRKHKKAKRRRSTPHR